MISVGVDHVGVCPVPQQKPDKLFQICSREVWVVCRKK